ncbi:hypothetical protein K449DRAFT_65044 [Hypoxylon sp. EC38]|nr:hypothetical protein K449DRAFT_65044 [Hypoxylon sp. EC38]
MPTLPTTQHIPKQEWEKRKGRIVDLYLTHGVKLLGHDGVIETMAKEGFTATKSQYELQFRQWGLHKYMRRHELDRAIQERKQRRQRGDPTPITFAGKAIPNSRIDRAERLLVRQKGQHNETALLDDDNVAQENTSPQIPTVEPYNSATINTVNHAEAQGIDQVVQPSDLANDVIGMSFHDTFGASAYMDNAGTTDLATFDFSVQKSYDLTLEPSSLPGDGQLFVESIDSQFLSGNAMNIDESLFSLPPYLDAPFDPGAGVELTSCTLPNSFAGLHWHRETRSKGHQITLPSGMIVAKIMEEIYSKNRSRNAVSQPNLNLACQFSTDINTRPCSNTFTPAPRHLFATHIFIGEEHYQFTKLPNDVACEARLNTRLITSVVNGFSGLQGIPAAGILTYLNRHQDTQLLMMEFLCSNSNPVARSLAENIFQAALQADNVVILNYLLDHSHFVDANETVCFYEGQRYTPLEMATEHHSIRAVSALIKRGVDINKSFSGSRFNALTLLIRFGDRRLTLDESFLGIVDALLEAGAMIWVDQIRDALYYKDPRLAIRLIEKCASQTPQELISDTGLVGVIVEHLEEERATNMVKLIMQKWQERDADRNYRNFLLDIP